MNVALRQPMTVQDFLAWAERQERRYEFDGARPVAMTGGSANHARIMGNLHAALRARLRGTPCSYFGPDLGLRTIGDTIRYPDALVTCTSFPGTARLAPDVVVVFEILSAGTSRTDRVIKVREYAAVPSIRRYVTLESSGIGLLVFERDDPGQPWRAVTLADGDHLRLPEIGVEIPVAELYEDVVFADGGEGRDDTPTSG